MGAVIVLVAEDLNGLPGLQHGAHAVGAPDLLTAVGALHRIFGHLHGLRIADDPEDVALLVAEDEHEAGAAGELIEALQHGYGDIVKPLAAGDALRQLTGGQKGLIHRFAADPEGAGALP